MEEIKKDGVGNSLDLPTSETSKENSGQLSQNIDISSNKPKVDKTRYHTMAGPVASGTHGGFIVPSGCFSYLAGAKVKRLSKRVTVKMLPPNHAILGKIKLKTWAVFVPHSRVWESADKFASQRSDSFENQTTLMPHYDMNIDSPSSRVRVRLGPSAQRELRHTTVWRDTYAYHYYGECTSPVDRFKNALDHRGGVAAFNDIFRDKRTQPALVEYKDDIVSPTENNFVSRAGAPLGDVLINEDWFGPVPHNNLPIFIQRGPTCGNYWNNWRSSVYENNEPIDNTSRFAHNVDQQMIDEYRAQAENVNKTDAEVIAELRGVRQPKENECFVIGHNSVEIDLHVQPQTAEGSTGLRLGEEGAISYTFVDKHVFNKKYPFEHNKDGSIHYFYQISLVDGSLYCDTVNIEQNKIDWKEVYRPGMKNIKDQPLYGSEISSRAAGVGIIGWRHWGSEYFRHPVFIRGDFVDQVAITNNPSLRQQMTGWMCTSLAGSTETRLATKVDWTPLRSALEMGNFNMNGVDFTDHAMRRLSSTPLPSLSLSNAVWRRRTNHFFYFYGVMEIEIAQPIAKEIANKFIPYGKE